MKKITTNGSYVYFEKVTLKNALKVGGLSAIIGAVFSSIAGIGIGASVDSGISFTLFPLLSIIAASFVIGFAIMFIMLSDELHKSSEIRISGSLAKKMYAIDFKKYVKTVPKQEYKKILSDIEEIDELEKAIYQMKKLDAGAKTQSEIEILKNELNNRKVVLDTLENNIIEYVTVKSLSHAPNIKAMIKEKVVA